MHAPLALSGGKRDCQRKQKQTVATAHTRFSLCHHIILQTDRGEQNLQISTTHHDLETTKVPNAVVFDAQRIC
jgi:hypothetical protein